VEGNGLTRRLRCRLRSDGTGIFNLEMPVGLVEYQR
jgi:hypothetical protein